jgi:hypothetical protein
MPMRHLLIFFPLFLFTGINSFGQITITVTPVGVKKLLYLKVFDRRGQLVFQTSDPKIRWDGSVNGILQATGVFVWLAEATDFQGNHLIRKGVVTLIR